MSNQRRGWGEFDPNRREHAFRANQVIYRRATKILARAGQEERIADSLTPVATKTDRLVELFQKLNVDATRITVGIAKADIDFKNTTGDFGRKLDHIEPEDFDATA